jgi:multidrug efflux pump subunit AcrA (membrane-fusion protein)
MAAPADLSKLRINRETPPAPVRRALRRNLVIFGAAFAVVAATAFTLKARTVPTVQVVAATASGGSGGGSAAGVTTVTANGYVVARTKASVSAKTAGRLAYLSVSEGSYVRRGAVIARTSRPPCRRHRRTSRRPRRG